MLGTTALVQALILATSGSVALLADLIHNFGDALTAIPLGLAFFFRSARGERLAGLAVVLSQRSRRPIVGTASRIGGPVYHQMYNDGWDWFWMFR